MFNAVIVSFQFDCLVFVSVLDFVSNVSMVKWKKPKKNNTIEARGRWIERRTHGKRRKNQTERRKNIAQCVALAVHFYLVVVTESVSQQFGLGILFSSDMIRCCCVSLTRGRFGVCESLE